MNVKFYLDKPTHKSETSIYVFAQLSGKRIKVNTGEKIHPKYWDPNKPERPIKQSYIGSPEFNELLINLRADILKAYRILINDNNQVSIDQIKTLITNLINNNYKPVDSQKTFFEVFDLFLNTKEHTQKSLTLKKYKTLLSHLQNFQSSKKISISFDIMDSNFHDSFSRYLLKDLKQTNNTVGKYISTLKTFLHWSTERGLNKKTDFIKYKVAVDKTDIISLTEPELLRLYHLDLANNPRLAKTRDVFCFGCFTGQRYSDIAKIKRDEIRNEKWSIHQLKGKKTLKVEIPLNYYALEILAKYTEDEKPLPIISNQKTNEYLKELCKLANFNDPITVIRYRGAEKIEIAEPKYEFISTHTARRTFVTLWLEKGGRPETCMEITGHTDYKTFKKYISITSKVKESEMTRIWGTPI